MRLGLPLVPLVAACALAALTVPAAVAAPQVDAGHDRTAGRLTAQARAAGLTAAGGGEMGWRDNDDDTPAARPAATASTSSSVPGIDVSGYQGDVNWASYYKQGKRFAYTKATEGTSYKNPYFTQQYHGSVEAGLVHGAYHFANPSGAGGAAQAAYFVKHGGGWTANAKTLPGALDIEYNPYSGGTCYGLGRTAMVSWIRNFLDEYKSLTGRPAVIYSTTDWWTTCTGNTSAFSKTNTLWIARYSSSVGTLPAGWGHYGFWQYSSNPVDQDRFGYDTARLTKFATG